jgi:Zn-dependent protease with chaperone function
MYGVLGACMALMGFLAVNGLGTFATALAYRAFGKKLESWPASFRGQFLFIFRVAPTLAAVFCIGALFVPSYLANEPHETGETVTVKIGLLTAASLAMIGRALWRALSTCRATRRLASQWLRHARPVIHEGLRIPAFRIQHRFPVIAVVGAMRPRLFIADQVFDCLSAEELAAAVAHEKGHLRAFDNFKKGVMHACRNALVGIPSARSLDQSWLRAAESAADDYASRGGASAALNLASALVKLARNAPADCKPLLPAGASLIFEDPGSIAARVLHLTQFATESPNARRGKISLLFYVASACLAGYFVFVLTAACSPRFLAGFHSALEVLISYLQ